MNLSLISCLRRHETWLLGCGRIPKQESQTTVEVIWDFCWYPEPGSNRHGHCWPQDFKSGVSTDSTIRAQPSAGRTSAKYEIICDPQNPGVGTVADSCSEAGICTCSRDSDSLLG